MISDEQKRISNTELADRLKQAGQAVQQVEKQKELERQAAEFNELSREAARRAAITQAAAEYDMAQAELTAEAEQIKQDVTDINQAIAEFEPQLNALAEKFSKVQKRIFAHFAKSRQATDKRFYAGGYDYDPDKPAVAQVGPDYMRDWLAIVGDESALKTISPYARDRLIELVLQGVQPSIFLNSTQLRELSKFMR